MLQLGPVVVFVRSGLYMRVTRISICSPNALVLDLPSSGSPPSEEGSVTVRSRSRWSIPQFASLGGLDGFSVETLIKMSGLTDGCSF